jgi:integrase
MGRNRTKDRHLPQRVYSRGGAFYFVDRQGKWLPLGSNYPKALQALASIIDSASPANTMHQVINRFVAEELGAKAEKTIRGRLQEFKPLEKVFGAVSAESIESHHVWTYWLTRGRTEQARHEIRALSTLLTYALRIGARKRPNPCFGLQLPGNKPRSRYVTDEEYLLVRELAPPMIGYAMDLALLAGFDQGTIRRLERRHVTDEGILIEREKTGTLQLIEWNDELQLTVDGLKRERQALICNRKGKPYSLNGFQSQWQRVMRSAMTKGLTERFTFHDLRAKSASDDATDQGAADRLGHGDVKLTQRVYRRLPRRGHALNIIASDKNS